MKTILATAILALTATAATAADVGVSVVRDNHAAQTGARVELALPEFSGFGITPTASVTNMPDFYTRYALGGKATLVQLGDFSAGVGVSGVYQATRHGENGYGVVGALRADYTLTKNVSVFATVERFWGQHRVSQSNGNVSGVGVSYRF